MDPHKRTKSSGARGLLHRVSSSRNVKDNNDDAASSRSDTSPVTPISSSPLAQTSTGASSLTPKLPGHMAPSTSSASGAPASIEQSVRLFRLYEALRAGDTAAISKAIKENAGSAKPDDGTTSLSGAGGLDGTSVLHLAVQCAELPVIEYVLSNSGGAIDINARDKDGNTPLHVAAMLSRAPVVGVLLEQKDINDAVVNYQGHTPLELAKSPDVFQQLQLARSMYVDGHVKRIQALVSSSDYDGLENLLVDDHFKSTVDVNSGELATDPVIVESGGTLLHEAARRRDAKLIQILLLNGADPFRRDRKGKLPQDITKDDKTKALLKKSPAAAAAQRGIQEKTILGGAPPGGVVPTTGENALGGKEGREMKGYLKKWTNYTSGYKLRWFVLEDGVLSYYKHQDDAGSACRGAINMKIAKLHMDAQDKQRFEIHGKSSVKYHLKANHQVEAKRWFWALNNAIQYTKDEAKEESRRQARSNEMLKQAKLGQLEKSGAKEGDASSIRTGLVPSSSVGLSRVSTRDVSAAVMDDEDMATSAGDPSVAGDDVARAVHSHGTTAVEGDLDEGDDYDDDASENEMRPVNKDAFMIAAHSARLQLDLLSQISNALQQERSENPNAKLSDPTITQALSSYGASVANLEGLIGDLGRITRDREAYWKYRLEQEVNVRRVWEDSMAKVAQEQEELQKQIGESEEKRKRTKRALRDALEGQISPSGGDSPMPAVKFEEPSEMDTPREHKPLVGRPRTSSSAGRRKSTIEAMTNISDSESGDDEEFFDAVGAGEVEVVEDLPAIVSPPQSPPPVTDGASKDVRAVKELDIRPSTKGYEDPPRTKLKMDQDNRPKISLWGILKSMIGKDMTKMTLPVSFNEPTSLLQRVAEDMEYTDLLDEAADRTNSAERMVYVAAFAASEYASTIGRVAKPFNPLLGETYEYVRPDKGYRFFIEQVSHHPPIGAAWAEAPKWDYYGESAVRSKFYGKSFDINPLGTWFLRLRPLSENGTLTEELYTWKKVTSSVVGIITGSPTVDNYGPMEVRNHSTGETCLLEFKQRGWKASSAYQVQGKVVDADGNTSWSIGGRWNDKIYARLTPGYEDSMGDAAAAQARNGATSPTGANSANQAFLVWEAHKRPTGIPFNLTPFVLTLNALTDNLRPRLPPTDTRLRPDQRAMEDGEYDFAATEKNRVEEKQRAKRRIREQSGEEWTPRWFKKSTCDITGEEYWEALGDENGKGVEYWKSRDKGDWSKCEDIF